ncbi:DUF4625 domain-containing protein [Daejeonella sp. JGW-45]|uniref:DUF4625 domain-containing protein n=1 Tax=Daejeonella sp. JGW-45 TaxID=3034148 RepID=UPI0023ED1403|nr:DUF4625 domain-containing protein [Daejeonella sp. JGW-45]
MNLKSKIMKMKHVIIVLALISGAFSACKKDEQQGPALKADNIEIGTANSRRGISGADFHFNADITARNKIENVRVKILQRSSETYTASWQFDISWEEYKGARSATVHKHFTIPAEAPEGKYDFYFIVTDQSGDRLEIKEEFTINQQ